MAQLEVEVELQEKITAAALRLAQDKSRSRNISKKRIQSFHKAHDKVTTSSCFVTCHVVNGNLKYVLFILCSITEVMISGEHQKAMQKAASMLCGVCGRGVGSDSIQCTSCQKWVRKKCSGINGRMYKVVKLFIC